MGCFSWMFANWDNERRLRNGKLGYLYCPNGEILKEPRYDGYGEFAGQDVYDLVADWNRVFLARHPGFMITDQPMVRNEDGTYREGPDKRVDQFPWYAAYADPTKTREEVVAIMKKKTTSFEWRHIGINIACTDSQNAALPYPIKICSSSRCGHYADLPPSQKDPHQGCYL